MPLPIPYYDGHVHIFPEHWQRRIYHWFHRAGWKIRYQDFYEESLWDELVRHGMQGASVLVYAHRPGIARDLNQWLYAWGRTHPEARLYGTVHPDDPDLPEIVETVLDSWSMAGFKIHANVQAVRLDDARLDPLYRAVLERNRGVVVHAGREPHANATVGVGYFASLMARYPRLRVQVAHLGFDEVEAFLRLMEQYPNLYLDTAAIPSTQLTIGMEALRAVIHHFPDRIIYGSDVPILEEPFDAHWWRIWEACAQEPIRQKVFRLNLERFWNG